MDELNRSRKANVREAAGDLLDEGKKWADGLREEGMHKVHQVEESVREYSDELLKKVQENPLSSILIAGGIGFLLSRFLRK